MAGLNFQKLPLLSNFCDRRGLLTYSHIRCRIRRSARSIALLHLGRILGRYSEHVQLLQLLPGLVSFSTALPAHHSLQFGNFRINWCRWRSLAISGIPVQNKNLTSALCAFWPFLVWRITNTASAFAVVMAATLVLAFAHSRR